MPQTAPTGTPTSPVFKQRASVCQAHSVAIKRWSQQSTTPTGFHVTCAPATVSTLCTNQAVLCAGSREWHGTDSHTHVTWQANRRPSSTPRDAVLCAVRAAERFVRRLHLCPPCQSEAIVEDVKAPPAFLSASCLPAALRNASCFATSFTTDNRVLCG